MKLLATSTLSAMLIAGTALAQTAPTVPTQPPAELTAPEAGSPPPPPPPGEGPDAMSDDERDQTRAERRAERREMRRQWREMRDDRRGPPRGGPHGPRPRSGGAEFAVHVDDNGELKLNVRCAEDEPMAACADIMMDLLDRIDPDSLSGERSSLDDDR